MRFVTILLAFHCDLKKVWPKEWLVNNLCMQIWSQKSSPYLNEKAEDRSIPTDFCGSANVLWFFQSFLRCFSKWKKTIKCCGLCFNKSCHTYRVSPNLFNRREKKKKKEKDKKKKDGILQGRTCTGIFSITFFCLVQKYCVKCLAFSLSL